MRRKYQAGQTSFMLSFDREILFRLESGDSTVELQVGQCTPYGTAWESYKCEMTPSLELAWDSQDHIEYFLAPGMSISYLNPTHSHISICMLTWQAFFITLVTKEYVKTNSLNQILVASFRTVSAPQSLALIIITVISHHLVHLLWSPRK